MRRQKIQKILRSYKKAASHERAEPHKLVIRPHIRQSQLPTSFTELQLSLREL